MFEVKTVLPGAHVYARHGAYVGRVEAVNAAWLRVREGGPEPCVLYIPRDALIGMLPGGEVFIDRTRSQLATTNWRHPPQGYPRD